MSLVAKIVIAVTVSCFMIPIVMIFILLVSNLIVMYFNSQVLEGSCAPHCRTQTIHSKAVDTTLSLLGDSNDDSLYQIPAQYQVTYTHRWSRSYI